MKKVGFVSVRNYNYGSILQAYALQQELFEAGIDNELIFYKKRNMVKQALRVFNITLLKAKAKDIWRIIEGKTNPSLKLIIAGRNKAFSKFLDDKFVFSPCLYGRKQLKEYTRKFSAFLLGSDQVWNPMLLGGDYYTLTWVEDNRPIVSYASSFGVSSIPSNQIAKTKKYLSRFTMISVREKQGAEIVQKLLNKKVDVCCDPTVLTDRKRWDDLSGGAPFVNGDYILCYFIGNNPSQRQFAIKLAKKTKCRILAIKHIDEYIKSDDSYGDIEYLEVGPTEFVNFIRYAKYVCTDSFHGTIFSILYNKTFFTFKRFSDGQKSSMNSRVYNILSIVGLNERLFENSSTVEETLKLTIDWDDVNKRLNEFKNHSREYFDKALECLKGMKQ